MTVEQLCIGRRVYANREFSGVPVGTEGKIVAKERSWPKDDSVAVTWNREKGDTLTDWFAFDELQFLDLVRPENPAKCCHKAQAFSCVCAYSIKCPEHGEKHVGSHE